MHETSRKGWVPGLFAGAKEFLRKNRKEIVVANPKFEIRNPNKIEIREKKI
jgi:hypothetical protein